MVVLILYHLREDMLTISLFSYSGHTRLDFNTQYLQIRKN